MDQARITKLRLRFDWSQERFAKALGVSGRKAVSHWETGFRSPSGPARRFLVFLEELSDSEFQKAGKLLERLAEKELRKRS
jgi:DNA-binding transcriptional regulator YiaG